MESVCNGINNIFQPQKPPRRYLRCRRCRRRFRLRHANNI